MTAIYSGTPNKSVLLLLLITSTLFSQWQQVRNDSSVSGTSWTLISNQDKIFAAAYNLYVSTDEGKTWHDVIAPGYFDGYVNAIVSESNRLYVGTGYGLHLSIRQQLLRMICQKQGISV